MSRARRRMYRRQRGQALVRRVLIILTLLVVLAGVASRVGGRGSLDVTPLADPTSTPVAEAFDETVETREISISAQTWYAIQTGVYSTEEAARERSGAFAHRGAPGYVVRDGEKWRVFIACYDTREDAAAVRDRLTANQQVDTYLHQWSCPGVSLRLSGMAGQLDVAEAGLALPGQTAAVLRDTAIALDAGEITPEGAKQTLSALGGQFATWADTARKRFQLPHPAMISQLLSLAENWPGLAAQAMEAGDATALSSALKQMAMHMYVQAQSLHAGWMN